MLEVRKPDSGLRDAGNSRAPAIASRTLLFIAPPDTMSDCLLEAVSRELPGFAIRQVEDLEAGCTMFDAPTSLVLIDATFVADIAKHSAELTRWHPEASVVIMYDDSWHSAEAISSMIGSRSVRAVLPMNVRLDLWLLIMRLIIRGGEYIPPSLLQLHLLKSEGGIRRITSADSQAYVDVSSNAKATSDEYRSLTEREIEILELVSRGYQNKVIAAEFNLSEHTVKVHIHNVIRKLGVHNRTGAAALYQAVNRQLP